jgi:hypothetical protein
MPLFQYTGWKFVTSGGGEIDIGLSKFLFVAGSAGAFYVQKDGDPTIWRLPFAGIGGGAGVGVSAGGPVTISVSMPFQPGGGFRIYRNPIHVFGSFDLSCFEGAFLAISGAAAVGFSGSGSVLIFGAREWIVNLATAMTAGMARVDAVILDSQGAGILWGTAETSAASVGVTMITGHIFAAQRAEAHETGD